MKVARRRPIAVVVSRPYFSKKIRPYPLRISASNVARIERLMSMSCLHQKLAKCSTKIIVSYYETPSTLCKLLQSVILHLSGDGIMLHVKYKGK